jgi:hypothetical protein
VRTDWTPEQLVRCSHAFGARCVGGAHLLRTVAREHLHRISRSCYQLNVCCGTVCCILQHARPPSRISRLLPALAGC